MFVHYNKPQTIYRHKGQLACLAALVTAKKTDLRATDNMQEILESDANNAGVYMEVS